MRSFGFCRLSCSIENRHLDELPDNGLVQIDLLLLGGAFDLTGRGDRQIDIFGARPQLLELYSSGHCGLH